MTINYWTANKNVREAEANYAAALRNKDTAEDILNRYTAWYEGISEQEYEASAKVIADRYEALLVRVDKTRELADSLRAVWKAADSLAEALLDMENLAEYWERG